MFPTLTFARTSALVIPGTVAAVDTSRPSAGTAAGSTGVPRTVTPSEAVSAAGSAPGRQSAAEVTRVAPTACTPSTDTARSSITAELVVPAAPDTVDSVALPDTPAPLSAPMCADRSGMTTSAGGPSVSAAASTSSRVAPPSSRDSLRSTADASASPGTASVGAATTALPPIARAVAIAVTLAVLHLGDISHS